MRWELQKRVVENLAGARIGALVTALTGLVLWYSPLGNGFRHWSFDLPVIVGPKHVPQNLVIVRLDETSYTELNQAYPQWDRRLHARLLNKLTADQARLAVFDVYFPQSDTRTNEDGELAAAIKANGRVVLLGDFSTITGFRGNVVSPPLEAFKSGATNWGLAVVELDADPAIRKHHPGTDEWPSVSWAAACAIGAPVTRNPEARLQERWMLYYGDEGTLPSISFYHALNQPAGFFKDKVVFIGGKPKTRFVREETDEFHTPYTHFGGPFMSGVEVIATCFLNLWRGDWLTELPAWLQLLLLVLGGLVFGFGLCLARPLPALGWAALGFVCVTLAACLLFWLPRVWFPWLLVAGAQIPCAWVCTVLWHTHRLYREKDHLQQQLIVTSQPTSVVPSAPLGDLPTSSPGASLPARGHGPADTPIVAAIPDHVLLRRIGKGAYGEVFLAKNAIGMYHAVKIVYRDKFPSPDPYEREFRGIQKFMPISLSHPCLVHVLHVGRNDAAGYFFYIMEAGDDETHGAKIEPGAYAPKNLYKELHKRKRLPVAECVDIGLHLTAALDYLHQNHLIHRDIKPSNIIFVNGIPKIADIGLVTDVESKGHDVTYVGTEGYIAPEGPGTASADVYSLGKVLYEMSMGRDRMDFPELPTTLMEKSDNAAVLALNQIILKACEPNPAKRYQTAGEMHADLERLQNNHS